MTELETSLTEAWEKIVMAKRCVKNLKVDEQESDLCLGDVEGKCRALKGELAALQSKQQTAMSRMLDMEGRPEQRVVVEFSFESKMVAALKELIATLREQLVAIKDDAGNRAKAVDGKGGLGDGR